jgi:nicotinamidase-related amidase
MVTNTILLAIDIQNEYITPGRPFFIESIQPSLDRCQTVISKAREQKIPIWHVVHKQSGPVFGHNSKYSDFISGFEPRPGELVFEKDQYSCFSSHVFREACEQFSPREIFIIGYGTSYCSLSTIIDGIHRGYSFTAIEDAMAAKAMPYASEHEMHESAIRIMKGYAKTLNSQDFHRGLKF